jgi:hypothetical protein
MNRIIRLFCISSVCLSFLGGIMSGSAQTFLTNGLVAYYPFNGNANDASGNGNDGTVQGATLTTDRFGAPNSAYYFDGISGGIKIPDTLLDPNVEGFTFSVWVGTDGGPYTAEYAIIHTGTDYGETVLHISSGQYLFGPVLNTHIGYDVTCPASSNNMTHVVGVYLRGQNISLYTNGVLANVVSIPDGTLWLLPTYPLYSAIGIYDYAPSPYFNFRGVIDDVRIYNRALSSNEVAQLFALESVSSPIVNIQKAVYLTVNNLHSGSNYQVQASSDLINWTNQGSVFTATSSNWQSTNYWNVSNWNQLFFRLQLTP